jgi:hypothetical protein
MGAQFPLDFTQAELKETGKTTTEGKEDPRTAKWRSAATIVLGTGDECHTFGLSMLQLLHERNNIKIP